jgi:hypothetical protein
LGLNLRLLLLLLLQLRLYLAQLLLQFISFSLGISCRLVRFLKVLGRRLGGLPKMGILGFELDELGGEVPHHSHRGLDRLWQRTKTAVRHSNVHQADNRLRAAKCRLGGYSGEDHRKKKEECNDTYVSSMSRMRGRSCRRSLLPLPLHLWRRRSNWRPFWQSSPFDFGRHLLLRAGLRLLQRWRSYLPFVNMNRFDHIRNIDENH